MKLAIMQFFQPRIISSLMGPNVLLSTLFSHSVCVLLFLSETKFHLIENYRKNCSFVAY
jgi:hypothetical protein